MRSASTNQTAIRAPITSDPQTRHSFDALATKPKRRAAFRALRDRLTGMDPLDTILNCRIALDQFTPKRWASGQPRPLSDPGDSGTWIAQASLNAVVAALRDAEMELRRRGDAETRRKAQS